MTTPEEIHDLSKYISPTHLPQQAKLAIKTWAQSKKPVFFKVFKSDVPTDCPNCSGMGNIYITFIKDDRPRDTPAPAPLKKACTYYPGDKTWLKGWYEIDKTVDFVCPDCNGLGVKR